jgi:hypothetical protein
MIFKWLNFDFVYLGQPIFLARIVWREFVRLSIARQSKIKLFDRQFYNYRRLPDWNLFCWLPTTIHQNVKLIWFTYFSYLSHIVKFGLGQSAFGQTEVAPECFFLCRKFRQVGEKGYCAQLLIPVVDTALCERCHLTQTSAVNATLSKSICF